MSISVSNVSFRGDLIYKDRYIPHKQDMTHDIIRADFEEKLGPYYFYYDQLAKEREMLVTNGSKLYSPSTKVTPKIKSSVDVNLMKSLKISAYSERRKDELFSGAQLLYKPEQMDGIKKAGIKSVYSLAPSDEYKAEIEGRGMKYHSLIQSGLSIFDINGDVLKNLIKNPESYVNEQKDVKIQGIKDFVTTLNGDNPEMPLPIYFGCHHGTDRTYLWFELYNILKDVDMDKPLPENKVIELAEYVESVDDHVRW